MTLNAIFSKPVDRHIEGVIKANDEETLLLELEEYVLTNEVEKRLESFLEAYNNYEGANGVWISGFFGSGKSHLLKMLAVLLENREISGTYALQHFLDKCSENEFIKAELIKAVAIPSKSILFNIDQKADIISKTEFDALLAVFVKVFDEMNGYYGKQGHVAQFERDLDDRGVFQEFKKAYKSAASKEWELGREQALLEAGNIAVAYAKATDSNDKAAAGILDKYRQQYKLSIEDFAEQVQIYINKQEKGFRLNFFVDEVGQYIADNVKLMTNLQTIAESLATKSKGAAWVIVTAQEDMASVLGELTQKKGNDFTKIQARFNNRMKLTSADVAEVIQKRLLSKTEAGVSALSEVYAAEQNNFRTLFDFAEGSQTYRNFSDEAHFVRSYPFIPYQFALFQASIQNLSHHNAFEGRHSSVGERSMLAVFQQVAIQIGDRDVGQLATFDLMFEGIRTALKTGIQKAVLQAEKHLEDKFAIKLLKALFLVKYVKEFKPTIRNLCVLMLENFDQDLPKLKVRIEESLNLLEQQTYIQRNGELFEFLTDEEKDVEQEIKNTDVDTSDVMDQLDKIIYDNIIKNRKIRCDENKQDYQYSRKLDDKLHGREHELAINVITPFNENTGNEQVLRMQNMGKDELMVLLPPDDRLLRDLLMYKRTEKYVRQNISITQIDSTKRILNEKSHQNVQRIAGVQQLVGDLIAKATLLAAENEVEINSTDAQTRIVKAFHTLIARAYPNLRMLRDIQYTEAAIAGVLDKSKDGLFAGDTTSLEESEQEVLSYIQSNSRGGVRTTLKSITEKFERKPYGWYLAAIQCTVASLCARGKLELRSDSNLIDMAEMESALRNTREHTNLIVEPQVEFTASQVRGLKALYADYFDAPPVANEAKALGQETATAVGNLIDELAPLEAQASQYPFLRALNPIVQTLKEYKTKPYTWFLSEFVSQEDELLDQKENIIGPIRKMMSGPQRSIFDRVRQFVEDQRPNINYINDDGFPKVENILSDAECFKGNKLQEAKSELDRLEKKVAEALEEEVGKAKTSIETSKTRLSSMDEFVALKDESKAQLLKPFDDYSNSLQDKKIIAVIRDEQRKFEETEYPRILSQMSKLSAVDSNGYPPSTNGNPAAGEANGDVEDTPKPKPDIEYVSVRNLEVSFGKAWLADEADVASYTKMMGELLLDEIKKGKRIQV